MASCSSWLSVRSLGMFAVAERSLMKELKSVW
jgi:hypothetical protein